jgi:hypothetical protein
MYSSPNTNADVLILNLTSTIQKCKCVDSEEAKEKKCENAPEHRDEQIPHDYTVRLAQLQNAVDFHTAPTTDTNSSTKPVQQTHSDGTGIRRARTMNEKRPEGNNPSALYREAVRVCAEKEKV